MDVAFEVSFPKGQMGKAVAIPFPARSLSGIGPAPGGEMQGVPEEGHWTVTFTGSYGNAGTGTILLQPGLVVLTLRLEKIREPRCARFYGSMRLVREG